MKNCHLKNRTKGVAQEDLRNIVTLKIALSLCNISIFVESRPRLDCLDDYDETWMHVKSAACKLQKVVKVLEKACAMKIAFVVVVLADC